MSRFLVSSSVTTAALVGLLLCSSPALAQAPPADPTSPPAPDPSPPPPTSTPTSVSPPATPGPSDDEEGTMVIKASRKMDMQQFAESSQQELKIAGARTRYALNLFGDVQLGAGSRSEGSRR